MTNSIVMRAATISKMTMLVVRMVIAMMKKTKTRTTTSMMVMMVATMMTKTKKMMMMKMMTMMTTTMRMMVVVMVIVMMTTTTVMVMAVSLASGARLPGCDSWMMEPSLNLRTCVGLKTVPLRVCLELACRADLHFNIHRPVDT